MEIWEMNTVEPEVSGENYMTYVRRPDGYSPAVSPLVARNSGPSEFTIEYKVDTHARAGEDAWDTGITYDESQPYEEVDILVMAGGKEKKREKPRVADGSGGGAVVKGSKKGLVYVKRRFYMIVPKIGRIRK
jgi:hypothetical protein